MTTCARPLDLRWDQKRAKHQVTVLRKALPRGERPARFTPSVNTVVSILRILKRPDTWRGLQRRATAHPSVCERTGRTCSLPPL